MEKIKSEIEQTNASIDRCKQNLNEIDALIERVSQRVSESKEVPEREAFSKQLKELKIMREVQFKLIGEFEDLKRDISLDDA